MDVQHSDDEEWLALQAVITEFASHLNVNRPDVAPALPRAPVAAERPDVAQSEPPATLAIPATTIAAPGRELLVSLMSAPPPDYDRSGRAPLVPPGPSAPPLPKPSSATAVRSRFNFLPDEPMKRPPPDPAARVFTATERTEDAILAHENAMRHPGPSPLERAVDEVKEGTVIGASIIAHAASSSASRLRICATVVTRAVLRGSGAVIGGTSALVRRSMRAIATLASAVGAGIVAGSRGVWRVSLKITTGILLATLAIGLGLAALVVGFVGAVRTGILLLTRVTSTALRRLSSTTQAVARGVNRASGAAMVTARRVDVGAGVAATRASEVSRRFLSWSASDLLRLKLTIRWQAHTARPIVGGLADAFTTQIQQSIRHARPRHAAAAVGVAVLIAAIYGAPRRDRSADGSMPSAPASTTNQPALASVAPTAVADAALVASLKDGSAAPAPAQRPQARPSSRVALTTQREQTDEAQGTARAKSMLGTLVIASAPKGAKVTIDGIPRGRSPLSVSHLRAGNRVVRLELDGYQRWSWAVYVSASRQTRLNVTLVPDSASSRSSAVTNTAAK